MYIIDKDTDLLPLLVRIVRDYNLSKEESNYILRMFTEGLESFGDKSYPLELNILKEDRCYYELNWRAIDRSPKN